MIGVQVNFYYLSMIKVIWVRMFALRIELNDENI